MMTVLAPTPKNPRLSNAKAGLLLIAASLFLGGCQVLDSDGFDGINHDYRLRHPITVEPVMAQSWINFTDQDLPSAGDYAKLDRFFTSYIAMGHGPVMIVLARNGVSPQNIDARIKVLQRMAASAGLRSYEMEIAVIDNVETADKSAAGAGLNFRRYVVGLPPCPDWSKSTIVDVRNTIHSNFGCATQSNFGAMVSDPLDMVRMRRMPPSSGDSVDTAVRTVRIPLGHPRGGTGTVSTGSPVFPIAAGKSVV